MKLLTFIIVYKSLLPMTFLVKQFIIFLLDSKSSLNYAFCDTDTHIVFVAKISFAVISSF
jgi:hypothetical protein